MSDLSQAGWGIVFPASLPQKSVDSIKDALKPLLALRQSQALKKTRGFIRNLSALSWASKAVKQRMTFSNALGVVPAPPTRPRVPYYILIAGSPETIPFNFQYQLDVQYAVGRIYFDRLEDYAQYAQSVVAETKKLVRPKKVSFFGVANPDDKATTMSFTRLIQPLAKLVKDESTSWNVNIIAPEKATKATLGSYMGGKDTPALLFSASHGMSFKPDDVRFLRHTGSILNQDWPGMKARQPVTDKMYFSADDIASDADVFGMWLLFSPVMAAAFPNPTISTGRRLENIRILHLMPSSRSCHSKCSRIPKAAPWSVCPRRACMGFLHCLGWGG